MWCSAKLKVEFWPFCNDLNLKFTAKIFLGICSAILLILAYTIRFLCAYIHILIPNPKETRIITQMYQTLGIK